ncbi:MAG: hypothetical protein H7320_18810 [Ferruginibacter sp.]|nr:hypothetical protein [Ferruginibacter sp.]
MEQKEQYLELNAEYYNQEKFSDAVTKRKINKHISDITDTITEEDIRNVKTDFGSAKSISKTEENPKSEIIIEPWDVLES